MFCRKCGCKKFIKYGDFIKIGKIIYETLKCIECGRALTIKR